MMTHLHPPTSSSAVVCLDRTGCNKDGFFGSATIISASSSRVRVPTPEDLPSSARIENDRTEMWITVGFEEDRLAGRLFATRQYDLTGFPIIRGRDVQDNVDSSDKTRPAWSIRINEGEGG